MFDLAVSFSGLEYLHTAVLLLDRDPSNAALVAALCVPVGPALSAALFAWRVFRDDRDLAPARHFWRGYRLNAVDVPGKVITIAPFTVLGQALQLVLNLFELDPTGWAAIRAARVFGVLVAGVVIAWMAVTIARTRPLQFLAYAYLAAALALPAVRSWYLLWGGLLLPLSSTPRKVFSIAIWTTVVLLCYNGINMAWRNGSMALGFAAAGGIWWLARTHQSPALADSKEERG